MKKCIIIVNLIFYITFLNQWNLSESHPTSSSSGTTDTDTKESSDTVTHTKPTVTYVTNPTVIHVTLDIEKTQSTTEFNYSNENDFHKYTSKSGYVFNKVVKKNTTIWESKNDIFGTQIMFIEGVRYLVILLDNNTFILLLQLASNWTDITNTKCDITNLKFFGENDTELSNSDYNIFIFRFLFTYIFNDGVKCKKIKLGDDEVWNHTDDPKFSQIKSFSLGLGSNNFFVKNQSDQTKELDFKASTPTQSTGSPASQTQSGTPAT